MVEQSIMTILVSALLLIACICVSAIVLVETVLAIRASISSSKESEQASKATLKIQWAHSHFKSAVGHRDLSLLHIR